MRPAFSFQLFLLFPQCGKKINESSVSLTSLWHESKWTGSVHGKKRVCTAGGRRCTWVLPEGKVDGIADNRADPCTLSLDMDLACASQGGDLSGWIDPMLPMQASSLNSRICVQLFSQELLNWELCMIPYLSVELVWRAEISWWAPLGLLWILMS